LIEENKSELMVRFRTWNPAEATRLENSADRTVEQHAARGNDPVIQQAVQDCASARRVCDLAKVREFCRKIEKRARELPGASAA